MAGLIEENFVVLAVVAVVGVAVVIVVANFVVDESRNVKDYQSRSYLNVRLELVEDSSVGSSVEERRLMLEASCLTVALKSVELSQVTALVLALAMFDQQPWKDSPRFDSLFLPVVEDLLRRD